MSGIIIPPFIGAPEEAPASSSSLLVYDELWVREPRLLIPGRRPVSFAGLKAKREVFGGGLLKSLLIGKYDFTQRGMWSGSGSDTGKALSIFAGGTVTAPSGFSLRSSNSGLAFLFRITPSSVVNYDPIFLTGGYSQQYVIQSDANGGVYAGWDAGGRMTPVQSGNGVFVANQTNDFAVWYGVHTSGSLWGIRLYKNRSLVTHYGTAAALPSTSPNAPYATVTGECAVDYFAAIDFGETWQGTANDAGFSNVVRVIQSDPYNELLELA